jgi:hypothetical protein
VTFRLVALGLFVGCAPALPPLEVGDAGPEFMLEDVNETSLTFGTSMGPSDYSGEVSVWYFGHANCGYCSNQFGELDVMHEAIAEELGFEIPIVGLNAAGLQDANPVITDGRDLPWLQDTSGDVWDAWRAEWRDIFVLDADGVIIDHRNLTAFDLTNTELFTTYQNMLIDVASD